MKIVLEFYRVRKADDAHTVVGRETADAADLDDAIRTRAAAMAKTLDMPQQPDAMSISDNEGNRLYSGHARHRQEHWMKEPHMNTRPARTRAQRAAGLLLDACRSREPAMTMNFPNPTRSFDEMRNAVCFVGHDGIFEIRFFVEAGALADGGAREGRMSKSECLSAFDGLRSSIHDVAREAYSITTSIPTSCPQLILRRRFPKLICHGTPPISGRAVDQLRSHDEAINDTRASPCRPAQGFLPALLRLGAADAIQISIRSTPSRVVSSCRRSSPRSRDWGNDAGCPHRPRLARRGRVIEVVGSISDRQLSPHGLNRSRGRGPSGSVHELDWMSG